MTILLNVCCVNGKGNLQTCSKLSKTETDTGVSIKE